MLSHSGRLSRTTVRYVVQKARRKDTECFCNKEMINVCDVRYACPDLNIIQCLDALKHLWYPINMYNCYVNYLFLFKKRNHSPQCLNPDCFTAKWLNKTCFPWRPPRDKRGLSVAQQYSGGGEGSQQGRWRSAPVSHAVVSRLWRSWPGGQKRFLRMSRSDPTRETSQFWR